MKKYIKQQKNYYKRNTIIAFICLLFLIISCSEKKQIDQIIIWTNKSEVVILSELFNASSDNSKVVIVYKENPAISFGNVKKSEVPDIIIGSWLNNSNVVDNFLPITYLFDDKLISKSQFYPQLLKYGQVKDQQYLLPVSFNIPAIVYSSNNEQLMPEGNLITPDQIKTLSANFNNIESNHQVTIGYAPSWDPEFMYEVAKLNDAKFSQPTNSTSLFSWDETCFQNSIDYFIKWTENNNETTEIENSYKYKYLSNPTLNNLNSNRSLFTYMPSNELFIYPKEKLETIQFKWLHKDNRLLINDDILSMGLYKYARNIASAEEFIIWFMNSENQKNIIQWTNTVNLYTKPFGIAGGFSSIRNINERYFPIVYPQLWGKLPLQENLIAPDYLPAYWETIKTQVLFPYMQEATITPPKEDIASVQTRVDKVYRYEH